MIRQQGAETGAPGFWCRYRRFGDGFRGGAGIGVDGRKRRRESRGRGGGVLELDFASALDEGPDEDLGVAVYGGDDRRGHGLGERLVGDL